MNNGDQVFVNIAINNMITTYLDLEQKNLFQKSFDFDMMVMKILILIYGELDIINSYKTMNEKGLGGFDKNLMKFGYPRGRVDLFKEDFLKWYEIEEKNNQTVFKEKNPYFVAVQKHLIDMFCFKINNSSVSDEEVDSFNKLLFTEQSDSSYIKSYNLLYAPLKFDISNYWNFKKYVMQNTITYEPLKTDVLSQEIYDWFSISAEEIKKLNQRQVDIINEQIYKYFNSSKDDVGFNEKASNMMLTGTKPKVKLNY